MESPNGSAHKKQESKWTQMFAVPGCATLELQGHGCEQALIGRVTDLSWLSRD